MSEIAYIDSSALLKLAFPEAETAAVEADLADRDGLISSRLCAIECARAFRRSGGRTALQSLEALLEGVVFIEISSDIAAHASDVGPSGLRALDAIHLASALSTGDPSLEVITYDHRLAEAARANGLTVVQPGRPASAEATAVRRSDREGG